MTNNNNYGVTIQSTQDQTVEAEATRELQATEYRTEIIDNLESSENLIPLTQLIRSEQANDETEEQIELRKLISKLCLHVYTGGRIPETTLGSYTTISCLHSEISNVTRELVANIYTFEARKLCIVACKGSETILDWYSNLKWFLKGKDNIPEWILNTSASIYLQLMESISNSNVERFIFTGHSRGGAIASYLGYLFKSKNRRFDVKIRTYACPSYANSAFISKFNELFSDENDVINKYTPLDPIQLTSLFHLTPGRSVYTTYQQGIDFPIFSTKVHIPGQVIAVMGDIGFKILFSIQNFVRNIGSIFYDVLHSCSEFAKYKKMSALDILLNHKEVFLSLMKISFSKTAMLSLLTSFLFEVFGFEHQHSMQTYSYHECGVFEALKEEIYSWFTDLINIGKDVVNWFWIILKKVLQFLQNQCKNIYSYLKSKTKTLTTPIERFIAILKALNSVNFV